MDKQPFISVIIPVYNGGKFIEQCLSAVLRSTYPTFELILVDDCSNDHTVEISRKNGVNAFHMERRSGPALARNYGARIARGDILFFVDADVVIRPDTVARIAVDFERNPGLGAVFGSYDDDPLEQNFLSQYKNIFHHFVHQQSSSEATTFWAGCGAVDRRVFETVGGFDGSRYPRPSIEDIELGYRIRSHGHRILLDKKLQAKHLKEWRLSSLLRTDILCRAIPWTKLILERQEKVNDLNLKTSDRLSGALVGLLAAAVVASIFNPIFLYLVAVSLIVLVALNSDFYIYLIRRKGLLFGVRAFPMHLLYYFYGSVAFVLYWCQHLISRKPRPPLSRDDGPIVLSHDTKAIADIPTDHVRVDGANGKHR